MTDREIFNEWTISLFRASKEMVENGTASDRLAQVVRWVERDLKRGSV
jgi:hypothetical protein